MISTEDLAQFIALGREQRGVEFKGPGSRRDKEFLAKVARASMAISNLRDGGYVILGITEENSVLRVDGLDSENLGLWRNYDDVSTALAGFCDPPLSFDLAILEYQGRQLVVLEIAEFESIPTLAARDHPEVLEKGSMYVRSLSRNASTNHYTSHELRNVLTLAAEKQLRNFLRMAERGGLDLTPEPPTTSDASENFEAQLGDFA